MRPLLHRPESCPSLTNATSFCRPGRIQREHHRRGGARHARAALGPHAAHDEHVPGLDLTAADRLHGRGAVVEYQRRARENCAWRPSPRSPSLTMALSGASDPRRMVMGCLVE